MRHVSGILELWIDERNYIIRREGNTKVYYDTMKGRDSRQLDKDVQCTKSE
jgi:hypothetical protein